MEPAGAFPVDPSEPDPKHASTLKLNRLQFVSFHLNLIGDSVPKLFPCLSLLYVNELSSSRICKPLVAVGIHKQACAYDKAGI